MTLGEGDCGRHFDDSVSVIQDWHNNRDLWEMPLGALVPRRIKGLLAAGRTVSADGYVWEIARIIPICIQTGEVAGLAAVAAVAAKERKVLIDELEVGELQGRLADRGWLLDLRALPVVDYQEIQTESDLDEVQH